MVIIGNIKGWDYMVNRSCETCKKIGKCMFAKSDEKPKGLICWEGWLKN